MKNKIIIAIIALIVVAGGVFAGLYFGTDIFKKDEAKEETSRSKELAKGLENYLEESKVLTSSKLEGFSEKLQKSSYSNEGTMSVKVSNISDLSELNNMKLSFKGQVDPSNKNFEQNVALSYNGVSVDANVVKNKNTFGLQSDMITGDEYIAIENNNLKDLLSKLGLDEDELSQIPNKIDLNTINTYLPSEEKLSKILDNYLEVIEKSIGELDSKKSGSTKTIVITEADLYDLIIDIFEKAKNDKELLNLIVEYSSQYAELSGESYSITTSDLQEALDEAIEEIKSSKENANKDNKIVVDLTYNSNNIVEKAEITVYTKGEKEITIEFTSTDDMIKFSFTDGIDEVALALEKSESSDSVEYEFTVSGKASGRTLTFADVKLSYENLDSDTVTQTMDMTISIPDGYQTESMSFNMTNEITFESVDITTLSDSNAVIVNNLSQEELEELAQEVYTRMNMY